MALFNYVFAKKHGGEFIVRIEDTDQARSSASSEQAILDAIKWLGLTWDEGPDVGGPRGPYRQSERLELYQQKVGELLEAGRAYHCFCSTERLAKLRETQVAEKASKRGYDGHCRKLDAGESARRVASGEEHTVRMKAPGEGEVRIEDPIRGKEIVISYAEVDDQVIQKSDGFPTYHLANIVDDHEMGITHVIRGEEWINSLPKHMLLYEAFGWEPPLFYHLGLLRNPDKNKSKLSKRKNPTSVFYYRDRGFLPETLLNFLGTLGFSMGDDLERFSLEEMIENFDWSRVKPGGPVFDLKKLEAFSKQDIHALDPERLVDEIIKLNFDRERLLKMVKATQTKLETLDDFVPYVSMFYGGSIRFDAQAPKMFKKLKKKSRKECVDALKGFLDAIEKDHRARSFEAAGLTEFLDEYMEKVGFSNREFPQLLRVGTTGSMATPGIADTLACVGKDRVRARLREFVTWLGQQPDWKAPEAQG
jgi:glutamyl-tRNA synthetase